MSRLLVLWSYLYYLKYWVCACIYQILFVNLSGILNDVHPVDSHIDGSKSAACVKMALVKFHCLISSTAQGSCCLRHERPTYLWSSFLQRDECCSNLNYDCWSLTRYSVCSCGQIVYLLRHRSGEWDVKMKGVIWLWDPRCYEWLVLNSTHEMKTKYDVNEIIWV